MGDEIGLALEHDLLLRVIQQNKERDPKLFEHIENTLMDFEDTRQPKTTNNIQITQLSLTIQRLTSNKSCLA